MLTTMECHRVALTYDARSVLRDVCLRLEPGWYGLVGANGAGKTTLLRLLAGDLAPTDGAVHLRPRGAVVALCPQEVEQLPTGDVDGALASRLALEARCPAQEPAGAPALLAQRARRVRVERGRWANLSPGERKRWQLAAALSADPDVLLLDEPTNHLDAQGWDRVLSELRRFRGLGVIVSHDRAVLESLCEATIWLEDGVVSLHSAKYGVAEQAHSLLRREAEEAHAVARSRVAHLASRLDGARRSQGAAERQRSSAARMKGVRDHDARSAAAKCRASAAEGRAGRKVTVLREQLLRAEGAVPEITRRRGGALHVTFERPPAPILAHLELPELRAGDCVLARDVRFTLRREDRIRIHGPNGAGKTTLLCALVAAASHPERILYVPQELDALSVQRRLAGLDRAARVHALALADALGADAARLGAMGPTGHTSPGEARKLALAIGLAERVHALILDEPTNHLDLPSIERLERALVAYPGALVLVTHDEALAKATTHRVHSVAREGLNGAKLASG